MKKRKLNLFSSHNLVDSPISIQTSSAETETDIPKTTKRRPKKKLKDIKDLTIRELCLYNYWRRLLLKEPNLSNTIYELIKKRNPISSRILEHLSTGYARKYNICLDLDGKANKNGEYIVAEQYFNHLPKTDTDPCRRGDLVEILCENGEILRTTISQLGSAIINCRSPLLKYAQDHVDEIRYDLDIEKKIYKKKKKKQKIVELPEKHSLEKRKEYFYITFDNNPITILL
jgi:hypothetical protein